MKRTLALLGLYANCEGFWGFLFTFIMFGKSDGLRSILFLLHKLYFLGGGGGGISPFCGGSEGPCCGKEKQKKRQQYKNNILVLQKRGITGLCRSTAVHVHTKAYFKK